jgi:hypothetical protein
MRSLAVAVALAVCVPAAPGAWTDAVFAQVSCGDELTADTTLTDTDPVVTGVCPKHGLLLGASSPGVGVTLDCGGRTIAGSGKGIGLKVGPGVEGATILNCVVDGFKSGIVLGGAGFHGVFGGVVTDSTGDGVTVSSDGNVVGGVVVQNNRGYGIKVSGRENEVGETSVAIGNGKAGLFVRGKSHVIDGTVAVGNAGEGLAGSGTDLTISGNLAVDNAGTGMAFRGGSARLPNFFFGNKAISNAGNGIVVTGANNVDDGENLGVANLGAVQCAIAGQACQ